MKIIILVLVSLFIVGCQGSATQKFIKSTKVEWPNGLKTELFTYGEGTLVSPQNSENNSTLEITEDKSVVAISGGMKKLSAEIEKAGSWIYFVASVILILAGIFVAYFRKEYIFGAILGVAGILIAGIPTILDELGLVILIGAILLVGAGIFFLLGKYIFKWNLLKRNAPAIVKLNEEGKPEEAMAVARAINPELDKEFKKKNPTKRDKNK